MRTLFIYLLSYMSFTVHGQFVIKPDTIQAKDDRPVYSETLANDPFSTSFLIIIENEVPAHFHKVHSEYVYVLQGQGTLFLEDSLYQLRPGHLVYIPPATAHSVNVTSEEPLKVLSIQSPEFRGKDRYFLKPRTVIENKEKERY